MDPRRIEPRFQRVLDVRVAYEGTTYVGQTRDVSLSGLCARLEAAFPFGTRLQLALTVPGQNQPIEVEGEVRWSQPAAEGGRYFGIQFLGLRARDVWTLNRYFHKTESRGGEGGSGSGTAAPAHER